MGADNYYLTDKYHEFTSSGSGRNLKYALMDFIIGYCLLSYWASLTHLLWYGWDILTATLPSAITFLGILNTDTVRFPTAHKAFTLGKNQGSFRWISFHLTHIWVTRMHHSSHLHRGHDYFLKLVLNSHSSLCCNLSLKPQTLDLRILKWRSHLSHCAFITTRTNTYQVLQVVRVKPLLIDLRSKKDESLSFSCRIWALQHNTTSH